MQEIKKRCGEDYPVSLRYSIKSFIKDWCKGGLPGEEFEAKGKRYPRRNRKRLKVLVARRDMTP